jgi:branched-subunit amino acid transport protein AzlD
MNENALTLGAVIIATLASGLVIYATRLFPFVLFSKKEPPAIIRFIEKFIPSMVIAILAVYCLKDIHFTSSPWGINYIVSVILVIVLHLTFKNSMISIFGSTICFMLMTQLM